jgi:myo-inositol-1(or 4)-monophosphatase
MIAAHFPDHSIVAEEQSSVAREGRFSWILDPIEGTVNFSTGFPIYGTSLALHDGETLLWSYVYLPSIRRRYSAILGEGAYCNGDRIRVASRSRLADSLATVMLTSHFSAAETEVACTVVRKLNMQLRGVRVLACSAAELSLLAHGAVDAVVCTKADVTGIAAGQLLVEEAGGRVSELGGAPIGLHSATMLATNGLIHEQICAALS